MRPEEEDQEQEQEQTPPKRDELGRPIKYDQFGRIKKYDGKSYLFWEDVQEKIDEILALKPKDPIPNTLVQYYRRHKDDENPGPQLLEFLRFYNDKLNGRIPGAVYPGEPPYPGALPVGAQLSAQQTEWFKQTNIQAQTNVFSWQIEQSKALSDLQKTQITQAAEGVKTALKAISEVNDIALKTLKGQGEYIDRLHKHVESKDTEITNLYEKVWGLMDTVTLHKDEISALEEAARSEGGILGWFQRMAEKPEMAAKLENALKSVAPLLLSLARPGGPAPTAA